MPNGEWLGNVWMPLNELTVVLRPGNTLNRFCTPNGHCVPRRPVRCFDIGQPLRRMNEYKSVQVTRILMDFYDSDPKRGHYGGGGLDAQIGPQPTTWAIRTAAEGPPWGS